MGAAASSNGTIAAQGLPPVAAPEPRAAQTALHRSDSADDSADEVAAYTEHGTSAPPSAPRVASGEPRARVPLNVVGGSHRATPATRDLCKSIGGVKALTKMIDRFYGRMFADSHLDQFVRDHSDPHARRLATWIAEKMGDGEPWSTERRVRPRCVVRLADGMEHVVHDRSSAHAAAWYSPKRAPEDVGRHFKLDDTRVWMRLMFWSARDEGLLDHPAFGEWFIRFIGHFSRIYERTAPVFARESARWSADPANTQAYLDAGRRMKDVIGQGYTSALASLPRAEREDIGHWPYH
eukprot:Hpha_TRINITY_DN16038_c6_g1::TRINITY_DN16038_c6_g1_i4::g.117428::m.117428